MEREVTLLGVVHPLEIEGGWIRVDHPVLKPLSKGNPEAGFEGDERLVVYLHQPSETFVLWRLESDGEYRTVAALNGTINPENVNRLCTRLVEIDQRRGFDAYEDVMDAMDAEDAKRDARIAELASSFSDKLMFGLARSHLPGVDVAKGTFTGFGG